MECKFQVGDKVVYIGGLHDTAGPVFFEGNIYDVRFVGYYGGWECDNGISYPPGPTIKVTQIPDRSGGKDIGYYAHCFRPVKPVEFWLGEKKYDFKDEDQNVYA